MLEQANKLDRIRGDLFGGLTAAVIALPLAIAFGVSSGLGAIAGIYGAIIIGFFAALFGGTPSQISGPTGPMTVVMATIVISYSKVNPENAIAIAFTVVIMAGFVQILFGIFRLGKYITLVPYPVISGFMTGIGIIIIILQIDPLFGASASPNVLQTLQRIPEHLGNPDWLSIIFTLGTVALLWFWPKRANQIIPGPIMVLVVGIILSSTLFSGSDLARVGTMPSGLPTLIWPVFDASLIKNMVYSAILLAGLGSIDSLLTSLVADSISEKQHDSDKELIGQGIGNMIAGFFGALPGAGATVRTVVNIRSGGSTPLSGMTHALILLLMLLFFGSLAEQIPLSVLAGLLIKVGIDIIDWRFMKRIHRMPLFTSSLTLLVIFITVFVDLIAAVMIGAFIANIVTIDRLTNVQLDGIKFYTDEAFPDFISAEEKSILEKSQGKILLFEITGPVSFGVARRLVRQLLEYKRHKILVIDLTKAVMVGITTSMVVEDAILREIHLGHEVILTGVNEQIEKTFRRLDIYKLVKKEHHFSTRALALNASSALLEKLES